MNGSSCLTIPFALAAGSRIAYSEAVWKQSTEAFIQCLGYAFAHFGGVPKRLVPRDVDGKLQVKPEIPREVYCGDSELVHRGRRLKMS